MFRRRAQRNFIQTHISVTLVACFASTLCLAWPVHTGAEQSSLAGHGFVSDSRRSGCRGGKSEHRLIHDGIDRHFTIHVPPSVCRDDEQGRLGPVHQIFALHCFGCGPEVMSRAFRPAAAKSGFVLVVPQGVEHSWSAVHCCGSALRRKLDDVGLLKEIKLALPNVLRKASGHSLADRVAAGSAFLTGWSNGGYLAMLAAMTWGPQLFAAAAPISGFQGEGFQNVQAPVPLMMHHAQDDPLVRYGGCCGGDPSGSCCCGLDGPCQATPNVFESWATVVNHCHAGGGRTGSIPTTSVTHRALDVECLSAKGCHANTTLCVHHSRGHFNGGSFHRSFPAPMVAAILDFFSDVALHTAN